MNRSMLPAIERNLFLPALAGFFIVGVWLTPRVSTGLWPLWLLLLALLVIVALRILRLPMRLAFLPLALMLALLWTQHWLYPSMPMEGRYKTITATVYGDSKINDSGNVTFTLTDISLDGEEQRGKAYAYIYRQVGDDPVKYSDGMRIRCSGKVYAPNPKENEYDFDFTMWMRQQGLRYGITSIENIEIISAAMPWTNYAQRIAALCHERLSAVMGEQADLAVAMLLGSRDALAKDDTQAFQRAGVAHIMAVSGLHVGILSMALIWLLDRLRLRKKMQIPILCIFLLIYCGITGFAVASLRAAVMVLLWVIAKAYGRKPNPVTVISTALLVVLIINPLQLYSAGFALSFSAITGITLLYPRIMHGLERLLPPVNGKKGTMGKCTLFLCHRKVKQTLAVSVSAQIGVLLPIANYYHHMYPYSLLFNLIIVPIVGVLMPLYAVTTLVIFIPWAGEWLGAVLGAVSGFGSEVLMRLVRLSNALPLAEIRTAQPNVWVYLAFFIGMVTVSHVIRASFPKRWMTIAAVIVIAAAGSYAQRPPMLRYHQFAAGMADSAMIVDGKFTIGIDTGNTGSQIINRILAEGRDLDALILTHLHSDHAGGVTAILKKGIQIDHVYLPVDYEKHGYGENALAVLQILEEEGVQVTCLAAGDMLEFRETFIEVLWPQRGRTRVEIDPNDRSLAMLITLGNVRILSMGDNGILYERYAAMPADILKVGHHGSRNSSSEIFLDTVNPALAMITARANMLIPATSTLDRMEAQDIQVLRSDETGEITIVPSQHGYRTYRYLLEENH